MVSIWCFAGVGEFCKVQLIPDAALTSTKLGFVFATGRANRARAPIKENILIGQQSAWKGRYPEASLLLQPAGLVAPKSLSSGCALCIRLTSARLVAPVPPPQAHDYDRGHAQAQNARPPHRAATEKRPS